jgi:diaminopimelate decarboxylase/aspartate kinase
MNSLIHAGLSGQAVATAFPESPFVVMKFGGTSVSTAENWLVIASELRQRLEEGMIPVVVHSALAGVSNALQALPERVAAGDSKETISAIERQHAALAASLGVDENVCEPYFTQLDQLADDLRDAGGASPRQLARIMAAGELAATALGAAVLRRQGLQATWHDARKFLLSLEVDDQTERTAYLAAACGCEPDAELQQRLARRGEVVLTQGFIGRNLAGETVLLGRGGSDTSAAYLAAKLCARRLEIWTDVPGLFTADPRAVTSARLLRSLHYEEAQEVASAGGDVLHPRCIRPLRNAGIPLFLRCTPHPAWEGTVVSATTGEASPRIKAISRRTRITLISMESMEMWQQAGFLAAAFDCFRAHGLSVDLISTSESNVTVSLDLDVNVTDEQAIATLVRDLGKLCRVQVIGDCAAVTLIGQRIRTILHQLSPALEVFEEQKIHLLTQASNDLNLTVVVDTAESFRLLQTLHETLIGRFGQDTVFGPTLQQLATPTGEEVAPVLPWWQSRREELLRIADQHDSAYVYDLATVRAAVRSVRGLASIDTVLYAMKANAHSGVLRAVHEEGGHFECVSPGEIEHLRAAIPGLRPRQILFTPNFAPREEYRWALEQGVWVTLDNLHPLRHWPDLFRGHDIFVRIDPGQGMGHHEHVRTAGAHSKFGIPAFELDELETLVAAAGARVVGLHAHTGSGILKADSWLETGLQLAGLRSRFPEVRYIDLGGGLGIPEKPGEAPLDLAALDRSLAAVRSAARGAELWLEPGRFLVAQAGVLLARVTQTKGKGDMRYVGVATGMNSLIRPALYGAYHEISNLSRPGEEPAEMVTVVGPICESGDRLGSDRWLPPTREGDVLAIANAGAYGQVMSSRYNLRAPAVEVLI